MYIENYTDNWKKYQSNHFCWRRPRPWFRRHQKECNVNCVDFFCLFDGRHGWKNHNQLKRTALK